jgi:hypothetical protein
MGVDGGNIKTGLKVIRSGIMDWIQLTEERIYWRFHVKMITNLLLP